MAEPRSIWHVVRVNRVATPTILALLTSSLLSSMASSSASATEGYVVHASTTLVVEDDALVQRFVLSCDATDAGADAAITVSSRDLRFLLAPGQAVASGVAETQWPVTDVVEGSWSAAPIPGARVFARLVARCGTADVFDEVAVDSAAVVVPPVLTPPTLLQRTDDLRVVALDDVPVGVEVEVVGLVLSASPRGDEVVTITVTGAGVDKAFDIVAADVVGNSIRVSPTFTPTALGEVEVTAHFLETSSAPVVLNVVEDDDTVDDVGLAGGTDAVDSCASTTGVAGWSALALGLLLRRRRR